MIIIFWLHSVIKMSTKEDLKRYILEALDELNGSASIINISKVVWRRHQGDLYNGGNIFYTWNYDLRWAAHQLQKENRLNTLARRGVWSLI